MNDAIKQMRDLHYLCVAPGGADCASDARRYGNQMRMLKHIPALLDVVEAARHVVDCDNDDSCGISKCAKAMDALEASLLKLEKQQ